jgi:hypothetical protein
LPTSNPLPQGERRGFDVGKATTGRGAHQTCHSTKRTHRFLADFLMGAPVNTWVAAESCERNRWVRFGKRTHREGAFVVLSTCFDLFLRRKERAEADAMERGRKESWGCRLRGNKLAAGGHAAYNGRDFLTAHGAIPRRQASCPTIPARDQRAGEGQMKGAVRLRQGYPSSPMLRRDRLTRLETDQRGQMSTGRACDETVT